MVSDLGGGSLAEALVQPDGRLVVRSVRLRNFGDVLLSFTAAGTPDGTFAPADLQGLVGDATATRCALAPGGGGRLLVGLFGFPRSHLARLLPDGSADAGFPAGPLGAPGQRIHPRRPRSRARRGIE